MSFHLIQELIAGTVLAALSQWIATHIAFWPARRDSLDRHWTERARRSWSAYLLVSIGPAILLGISMARAGEDIRGWEGTLRLLLLPLCISLGALVGSLPVARRILRRPVRLSDLLRGYGMSFLVLAPGVTVFLIMLILLFSQELGPTSIGIMLSGLLLSLGLTLGLAIPIVRAVGLLTAPPQRLVEIVQTASEQAQIPPPPVYLLHWHQANAVAFPFAQILAFTKPALEILTDEELGAVCLHEIAHLRESRQAKLTRLSGLLVLFPLFTTPVWFKSFGTPGILVPLAIFFIGSRLLRGFSQRMETEADAAAYKDEESAESCYAQALEKIYEYNAVPAVMRGKSQSHPHLYDRLVAAGVTPEYPRPKAPSIALFFLTIFLLVIGIILPLELLERSGQKAKKPRYRKSSQYIDGGRTDNASFRKNLTE